MATSRTGETLLVLRNVKISPQTDRALVSSEFRLERRQTRHAGGDGTVISAMRDQREQLQAARRRVLVLSFVSARRAIAKQEKLEDLSGTLGGRLIDIDRLHLKTLKNVRNL